MLMDVLFDEQELFLEEKLNLLFGKYDEDEEEDYDDEDDDYDYDEDDYEEGEDDNYEKK